MSAPSHQHRGFQERTCRKVADWPEMDRRLWLAALEPGDLLEGGGSRSRHRPISNRKIEWGYGRWLTFLDQRGDLKGSPADRITPGMVTEFVAELRARGNSPYTIRCRLQELNGAAAVMDARCDWLWIGVLARRVCARQAPTRDKSRSS
jgi:hypothetical protein